MSILKPKLPTGTYRNDAGEKERISRPQILLTAKQRGREKWEALSLRASHRALLVGNVWLHTIPADPSPG